MAIGKNRVPKAVRIDLETSFDEGREVGSDGQYRKLLRMETTNGEGQEVVFYGDKGRLRRFKDERQPQNINEYSYLARVKTWEMTHAIRRETVEDDRSGVLLQKAQNFGTAVEESLDAYTIEFLRLGSSTIGFDKAPLFSESHRYVTSSGATVDSVDAQSNMNLAGLALGATSVQDLREHFANIKSDKDKPMNMRLTDILVKEGSDNQKAALELANSQYTVETSSARGGFTENIYRGSFNVMTTVYSIGASEWFGFDLSDPEMRPIVMLEHASAGVNNLEFTAQLEDSHDGFWRNSYAFGVRTRVGWNPGDWRSAYLYGSSNWSPSETLDNEYDLVEDINA